MADVTAAVELAARMDEVSGVARMAYIDRDQQQDVEDDASVYSSVTLSQRAPGSAVSDDSSGNVQLDDYFGDMHRDSVGTVGGSSFLSTHTTTSMRAVRRALTSSLLKPAKG